MTNWCPLFLLLIPFDALCCQHRVTTRPVPETFDSELTALRALATHVLGESASDDVEFAGAIYRLGERAIRVSVGRGCPGVDRISFSAPSLDGHTAAAYWHTHGRDAYARELFSPEDAQVVLDRQRPFYLITPRGEIRVLDPAAIEARPWLAETRRMKIRRGPWGLRGRYVGSVE